MRDLPCSAALGRGMALAFCLSTAAFAGDLATAEHPESLGFSAARLQRIGSWYRARVDAGALPGAVVAIARNGKLAYLEAVGFQDNAKTIAMKPDAIFWIASMTKPVTSVAAMMLVEEGKLDLDAPVSQTLPELKDMQVGVEKPDPVTGRKEIALEPPKRLMTVRDLLRHTSGLVYPPQFTNTAINRLYRKAVFERDKTLADFVASLADLPLAHQPGEVWEYSWSVDVLARVVEVASGLPFDQFLQDRIFGPLHMVDTGFYVPEAKLARLVDAPEPRDPQFDVTRPRKLLSGGGGLVSTARLSALLPDAAQRRRTRWRKNPDAANGAADGDEFVAARHPRHWGSDRACARCELGIGLCDPHQSRIQPGPGIGRQLHLERRLGHVLLDRSGGEDDRPFDDSGCDREDRSQFHCHP
jgi:CubicO group peptidase (beta-lactamase class C family)